MPTPSYILEKVLSGNLVVSCIWVPEGTLTTPVACDPVVAIEPMEMVGAFNK